MLPLTLQKNDEKLPALLVHYYKHYRQKIISFQNARVTYFEKQAIFCKFSLQLR